LKISLSVLKKISIITLRGSTIFICTLTKVGSLIPKSMKVSGAMALIYWFIQSSR